MARFEDQDVDPQADHHLSDEGESDTDTHPRTLGEGRRHDQETLTGEEEAQRLLARDVTKRDMEKKPAKRRRRARRSIAGKEGALMYEMEEGGPRSSSAENSGHSSEVDLSKLGETQARQKSRRSRVCGFAALHVVIILAFLTLLYGAWRASSTRPEMSKHLPLSQYRPEQMSNGTHKFKPTTILVSLDGFRADFLHRNLTPTLSALSREGVSPKYMNPSFPSLTFPNHFTLVTGMHPESHGIVGNTFWDPVAEKEFYYTDPARSMSPEWWNAEPLWVTAEMAGVGVRTAVHMWPGSEAHIGGVEPAYVDEFNEFEPLDNKVDRVLGWLNHPEMDSEDTPTPQLIALYVPNVDFDGHKYGPNSTYIRSTITEVDGMLAQILNGVAERNLTDIVNIVIVSDHGMATVSTHRLIQLEDLIDTSLVEHTDGWPLYGLRPYNSSEEHLRALHDMLQEKARSHDYRGLFDVYLRDKNMPERYHFSHNPRIAPLWLVPIPGWAIVTKDEYNVAQKKEENWPLHGLHGYDNQHPLMRAIFVARGPAFPHIPGSELEPFQNIEVYNIVCDSLGIEPVANNGTLRLPLTPKGQHDLDEPPEVPDDPQDDESLALPPEVPNLNNALGQNTKLPPEVANLANRPEFMVPTENIPPVTATPKPKPTAPEGDGSETRPVVHDGLDDDEKGSVNRWWEWVNGKIGTIKAWANGVVGSKTKPEDGNNEKGAS